MRKVSIGTNLKNSLSGMFSKSRKRESEKKPNACQPTTDRSLRVEGLENRVMLAADTLAALDLEVDQNFTGTEFRETFRLGSGSQQVVAGEGNDRIISMADAGEPDPAQTDGATGRQTPADDESNTDDVIFGGSGADVFEFRPLLNATDEVIDQHSSLFRGIVNWQGVAGENDNVHDHWVEGIGNDIILDFNKAEEDQIVVNGHTATLRSITYGSDELGDFSLIEIYSQQGDGNNGGANTDAGAHDEDSLGTIKVYGDQVTEDDIQFTPAVFHGIEQLTTADRLAENNGGGRRVVISATDGDQFDGTGAVRDIVTIGQGSQEISLGASNDIVFALGDAGEPDPEQGGGRVNDPVDPELADDVITMGQGRDTVVFQPLINAKESILAEHTREDGTINWRGVAGENDNVHDHWVEGIGNDTVVNFSRADGDRIRVHGHTATLRSITYGEDEGGDFSLIEIYSEQGDGNAAGANTATGAHDEDPLGTIKVYGDRVTEEDIQFKANVFYGVDRLEEASQQDNSVARANGLFGSPVESPVEPELEPVPTVDEDPNETPVENVEEDVDPTPSEDVDPTPGDVVDPTLGEDVDPVPNEDVDATLCEGIAPTVSEDVDPAPGEVVDPAPDEVVAAPDEDVDPTPGEELEPTLDEIVDPAVGEVVDPTLGQAVEFVGTQRRDTILIGSGNQIVDGGQGNDRIVSMGDGGEPDPAQTENAEGRVNEPVPEGQADDVLTGGDGADVFEFRPLLNATETVQDQFRNQNRGFVNWRRVAGENDNVHDHWVEGIGNDIITDFSLAEGDQIRVNGHTATLRDITYGTDELGDYSLIEIYSQQGDGNNGGANTAAGAHDEDPLGTIKVYGDRVTEEDIEFTAAVFHGMEQLATADDRASDNANASREFTSGTDGAEYSVTGRVSDLVTLGRGSQTIDTSAGNDRITVYGDGGEPEPAQGGDRITPAVDVSQADDVIRMGQGRDVITFSPLLNAKTEILAKHTRADGSVNWRAVAGENDNVHDHWVEGIGNDTLLDFSLADGDRVRIIGHTATLRSITYGEDERGDFSLVTIYSQQGDGANGGENTAAGAHDEDPLGSIRIYGDRVTEDELEFEAGVFFGIDRLNRLDETTL